MGIEEIFRIVGYISEAIIALSALYGAYRGHKNSNQIDETSKQIQEVHLSINSRMDQLLAITKTEAHAAGVEQERSEKSGEVPSDNMTGEQA